MPNLPSGWACMGVLVQFYDLPFNPQHMMHELGADPIGQAPTEQLLLGFKKAGLKAGILQTKTWTDLAGTPLPAMAQMKNGEWVVLAKTAPDKVLIHNPLVGKPEVLTRTAFEEVFAGTLLLVNRRR